ncbi:mannose-1-phosphate guanylyltransferase OS=Castellaniella defragrans OX=75697 GN=HNR28_002302 PE=3 SV=1 [Castellaniella defragrans]
MISILLYPIILAGGSGTRLWPLSRELKPKQFLPLFSAKTTMLQDTILRLKGLDHANPLVICNETHRFLAAEQLRELGVEHPSILLEPSARNTAPAIALAALQATQDSQDPLLLVLPADHVILDTPAFQAAVLRAQALAQDGKLVTFGIVPTCAETGYGYIERGEPLAGDWRVKRFVEKPDAERASQYLAGGQYLWNGGMFLFKASRYLQELQAFRPDILSACREAFAQTSHDMDFIRVDAQAFARCPSESIDYAVMEHTQDAAVVELDAGWSDVGAWAALSQVSNADEQNNVRHGDTLVHDVQGTLIHANSRLVAAVGVQDLVIVETKDAVLVAHKDKAQDVKRIVEQLKASHRSECEQHREVYRPWGVYDSIDNGQRYQVKRITVKPGAKLSVQMHHHRAEHWVVVSGTARVTNGEETYLVTENQSTYIPIGRVHSLENPGVIPLELIEVQSGSYLGEDDIVRLEDRYGRQ